MIWIVFLPINTYHKDTIGKTFSIEPNTRKEDIYIYIRISRWTNCDFAETREVKTISGFGILKKARRYMKNNDA